MIPKDIFIQFLQLGVKKMEDGLLTLSLCFVSLFFVRQYMTTHLGSGRIKTPSLWGQNLRYVASGFLKINYFKLCLTRKYLPFISICACQAILQYSVV